MANWKEGLTIFGSFLGAFAFIQNQIQPIFDQNKKKWDKLNTEIINEMDFKNLIDSISVGGGIPCKNHTKLQRLVYAIDNRLDTVAFKSITSRYSKQLKRILKKHNEYIQLVQVPYWEPHQDEHRHINKNYFYKESEAKNRAEAENMYLENLDAVIQVVKDIEDSFIMIGIFANRTMPEWIWCAFFQRRAK